MVDEAIRRINDLKGNKILSPILGKRKIFVFSKTVPSALLMEVWMSSEQQKSHNLLLWTTLWSTLWTFSMNDKRSQSMNYEWQKARFSVINDIMNDIVNDQKGHNIVNDTFVHKPDGLLVTI